MKIDLTNTTPLNDVLNKIAPAPAPAPHEAPFARLVDDFVLRATTAMRDGVKPEDLQPFDKLAVLALGGVAITFWLEAGEVKARVPAGFKIKLDSEAKRYIVEAIEVAPAQPQKASVAQAKRFVKVYGSSGANNKRKGKRK